MPRELEAQLCTNGVCQRMGRPRVEHLLVWHMALVQRQQYLACKTDINLKHEYLGTDVPPPFSKHTNRQDPELGRTVRGEGGVRIEVIVKGPSAMQSAKMDGIAWHDFLFFLPFPSLPFPSLSFIAANQSKIRLSHHRTTSTSQSNLLANINIMKYSAVTLLAALAAYSQAQSISIPGGDEVSSIIGDVSSRIGDASSIIEDVSTRVGDEVSSRVGDISSRISTATETGASATVTDASTVTDSAETESETGSSTVDTSALGSVTSALASASSVIEDKIASLSSDLATATGTASEALESKINALESSAGAIESSAGAAASSATGDNAGAMPTAAVAMGALMGGAALFANM
ncbi:vegetative incompatibility het-e-1 [Fusarium agapanthi]|uniref:Vegetative incompatibility het-e-1 n=1 Tax=Fusarium agapanthi TaxID=1803897 RepID=A0A9P5B0Z8_9HYPO|nr:vegetative incompatibility het-e-1 [Fusarium agapanthi]